jgi:hypothetical protein
MSDSEEYPKSVRDQLTPSFDEEKRQVPVLKVPSTTAPTYPTVTTFVELVRINAFTDASWGVALDVVGFDEES